MLLSALILSSAIGQATAPAPRFELLRQFKVGEKLTYQIRSKLYSEQREEGLAIFLPSEFSINYDTTIEVKGLKTDGFAEVVFRRPTMTMIEGETAESPPKTKVEKTNYNLSMVLSPINEVTEIKDLNAPAKPPAKPGGTTGGGRSGSLRALLPAGVASSAASQDMLGELVMNLHRMALFIGSLDSSIDLAPKLPYDEVRVGETWKRTASYAPQVLQGSGGRMATQRLDFTFTYNGLITQGSRKLHQITGVLNYKSDAGAYFNQLMGTKPEESGIRSIPMTMDSKIVFLLDEKTRHTISVAAESKGDWSINIVGRNEPVVEERFNGTVTSRLVGA